MPGKPAARVGDYHLCPVVDGSKPHEGGGIQPAGATCVQIGGKPAARVGDLATCKGPPDVVATGAMPVLLENQPATRMGDTTAHGGTITEGECTVLIGSRGITGNLHTSKLACEAMAKGRDSGSLEQSYQNCGLEACRQIIQWATGSSISEDKLFDMATRGLLSRGAWFKTLRDETSGGTTGWQETEILRANGVPSTATTIAGPEDLQLPSSQLRGMVAGVDAAYLPYEEYGETATDLESWHSVVVTGIEYNDEGEVVSYYINDTGIGICGMKVGKDAFENAMKAYGFDSEMAITDNAVW